MKKWTLIGFAVLIMLPGLAVRLFVLDSFESSSPPLAALLFGTCVVGAAFLLSWAIEAAQMDVPPAFALSVMALIAVLPEYSVDFVLTHQAGSDPAYQQFAVANMIGANRMIVGIAWPLVIFLFILKFRRRSINLGRSQRVEIGFLLLAGLYSLTLPLKGEIDLYDVFVFVGLFIAYTVRIAQAPLEEPDLMGPAAVLGEMPRARRVTAVALMLIFSGAAIFLMADPFADSLIDTGTMLGADPVFMVQWFAPLASEAPEIIVCAMFTWRGLASDGLGALVASKVNQWTLLVGTLPLVFSLGSNRWRSLPLHGSYVEDGLTNQFDLVSQMLLTSGQTLLAVMIILNLRAGLKGAFVLIGLMLGQFFLPAEIGGIETHIIFAAIYLVLALLLALRDFSHFLPTAKSLVSPAYVREQVELEEAEEEMEKREVTSSGMKGLPVSRRG
ncbi:MAG TPA: hypothetical protein VH186_32550 [Chloroflexia bacterium]|nr:hypothetical protein [Chloroflexia bacterium]